MVKYTSQHFIDQQQNLLIIHGLDLIIIDIRLIMPLSKDVLRQVADFGCGKTYLKDGFRMLCNHLGNRIFVLLQQCNL